VVCIRENDVLTRRSKNWTKHRLAIEDPFELSHNLAAGVSHKSKFENLYNSIIKD
jgi:terminal uridylyltransferase